MFYTHAEFSEMFSQAVLLLAVFASCTTTCCFHGNWYCIQNISDLIIAVMMPFTLRLPQTAAYS